MKRAELYCEGYDDRSFLTGWLESRGWENLRKNRGKVINPLTNKDVKGGSYAFQFEDSMFLEVIPSRGREKAIKDACRALRNALTAEPPPAHILVALDLDEKDLQEHRQQLIQRLGNERSPEVRVETGVLIWHTQDDFGPGVPKEQTLERLVCGALTRTHTDRGLTIQNWLDSTGNESYLPKHYSWSHMAGWYAKHGCDNFFRQIWREEAVRRELAALLSKCGAEALGALEASSRQEADD